MKTAANEPVEKPGRQYATEQRQQVHDGRAPKYDFVVFYGIQYTLSKAFGLEERGQERCLYAGKHARIDVAGRDGGDVQFLPQCLQLQPQTLRPAQHRPLAGGINAHAWVGRQAGS